MSSNSQQQQPQPQPQQQKMQASAGAGSKAATLKQLKAAQQLKNLLKASASIDEQPDEEADASKESEIEESAAKKTIPLLNKQQVKLASCQDNHSQRQQQQQQQLKQLNMSDSQEDSIGKRQRQVTLGANQIITRRYSGPAAQSRVAGPNHQLNTRKSFENSQGNINKQQGKQLHELDNESQVEYRASLQPVYEPKHYLANCVPIQFIPLAASSGQQQIGGAFARRRSPVSCSCLSRTSFGSNSALPSSSMAALAQSRRQTCSNFCCQLQQQLIASQIDSSHSRNTSPHEISHHYSTGTNEQYQTRNKSPSEQPVSQSTLNDNTCDLHKQQQQYYYPPSHHYHRQHPCFKPQDLRRYSACVASASCATTFPTPNDTFSGSMAALRRRNSTTTRLRRLSVFGQSQTALQRSSQQQPTSTSFSQQHHNQNVTQEIKVAPTQASSRIKSPSSRRHTLAIVSGTW